MESICALIFTLILMFPLVIQLQMLIANPRKLCSVFHYYASQDEADKQSTPLISYYSNNSAMIERKSDSKLLLSNLRTVSSSPAVACGSVREREPIESQLEEPRHSSTFVKTNQVLPVVDITWTYSSYRYKAFEACLRDHYGAKYPPGEVLLNSMQLNLLDSKTSVDPKVAGLFDFVKENEAAINGPVSRKLEIEYLNPLDHFVNKQLDAPCTEERCTECEWTKEDRLTTHESSKRDCASIKDVINEKNCGIDRRSNRKIEVPCKCYLSKKGFEGRGC